MRFGRAGGKQLAMVAGRPVVAWSVRAFERAPEIDAIVVVADPDRLDEYAEAASASKVITVVPGGTTRQDSVEAGLAALPEDVETVAVHDGARPLVTPETIACAVRALEAHPGLAGVVVGQPMADTVKRVRRHATDMVAATPCRDSLWVAQTPQVFPTQVLRDAYALARADGFCGTDDSRLVERAGGSIMLVRAVGSNVKVTVPEDLAMVEGVLARRAEEGSDG
jgi:2-C-methyl-D-erythritol 4-phosphate cytidylyltransferase